MSTNLRIGQAVKSGLLDTLPATAEEAAGSTGLHPKPARVLLDAARPTARSDQSRTPPLDPPRSRRPVAESGIDLWSGGVFESRPDRTFDLILVFGFTHTQPAERIAGVFPHLHALTTSTTTSNGSPAPDSTDPASTSGRTTLLLAAKPK